MKTLFEILGLKRPHGGANERHVAEVIIARTLDGLEVFNDDKGQPMAYVFTTDPTSRSLFCAHLDTVHHEESTPNPVIYDAVKKHAFKVDGTCLGADCGAGVFITLKMAEAGVPGTYVWTVGEECGGVGARWLADNAEEFLKEFDRAIAFDRQGTDSVITHQGWGGRCCSNEFARTLAERLSTTLPFVPDATGVYTDTAEWTEIIPECTNLSIGYLNQHSGNETLDVGFLEALLATCIQVDWESLPTKRDPLKIERDVYSWRNSPVETILFEDLYGLTEGEIAELVYEEPEAIAAMLYRGLRDDPLGFIEDKEADERDMSQWNTGRWADNKRRNEVITAYQASKLTTATRLQEARKALLDVVSQICWQNEEHRRVHALIAEIDTLFASVLPNEKEN